MTPTPVRAGDHEVRDGVRLLRPDPDIPYRDGAEDRVYEIVCAGQDLSSDSTELLEAAQSWAERYHTHPSRANVLRALDIPAGAAVLEIGAGCGPITRYLGETGAIVDSVEPVLSRARVGRARTRDLENVAVFCGNLEDVPVEPAYDLVVVVGVLEYVGDGEPDPEPYLAFLRACRARLKAGGALVLAIENKLGVKYLTGTGEDHSGRIFDSIEDYPRGSPARTFSATALLDLVRTGGFTPSLYGVFPDYKHTRVVFDTDALAAAAPDLLENLPSFPSRFAGTRTLKLASEARVWKELVRDGLGAHFANSFLVVAGVDDEAASRLWPHGRLARYFSINRRREYVAATTVSGGADGVHFDRIYSPEPGPLIVDGTTAWAYVSGPSFLDVYRAGDDDRRRLLLRRWLELVDGDTGATGERVALDAIPSNVIVTGDVGPASDDWRLELIDSEFHDEAARSRVVERGLLWLAVHLARSSPPELWRPARTIRELMLRIAEQAEVELDDDAIERLLAQEGAFQVAVSTHYLGESAQADAVAGLRDILDGGLWDTPLGRRLHHDLDDTRAAYERLDVDHAAVLEERTDLRRRLKKADADRNRLRGKLRLSKRRVRELKLSAKRPQEPPRKGLVAAVRRRVGRLRGD